jgi:hypothetical protein
MPASESSVDRRAAEGDTFFELAASELRRASRQINLYAALLEVQIAQDPSMSQMRELVHEVRVQADRVASLVELW